MIRPTRIVRGLDEQSSIETWVFSRVDLNLNNRGYNGTGIKIGPLFAAGLIRITMFYNITGVATTTIKAKPMDENDQNELPFTLTVETNKPPGPSFSLLDLTQLVCTSFTLEFISSGNSAITAAIFGRTA